jgi:hypothetical protein
MSSRLPSNFGTTESGSSSRPNVENEFQSGGPSVIDSATVVNDANMTTHTSPSQALFLLKESIKEAAYSKAMFKASCDESFEFRTKKGEQDAIAADLLVRAVDDFKQLKRHISSAITHLKYLETLNSGSDIDVLVSKRFVKDASECFNRDLSILLPDRSKVESGAD